MRWLRRLPEAPVTLALILVNLLVYAAMVAVSRRVLSFDTATLIDAGASVSGTALDVSRWRWLTAAFVHVNLLHIGMNLWVLGQIGVLSERALGRGLFAAIYVVTGTLGNLLSSVLATAGGGPTIAAGASGAIMGLIGAAAVYAWRTGQRAAARVLAFNIVFVLGVGLSLSARGIKLVDNAAHIGGLLAGGVVGLWRARARAPWPRSADVSVLAASAIATLVAFAAVQFFPG
jgi:membrane associated rhomboid family serine protease